MSDPLGVVPPPEIPPSLIVESLDPNCLMLLIEGEAGAEVEMHEAPFKYLGDVSIYRNAYGEPMVRIDDEDGLLAIVFLAGVKRITVL